MACVFSCHAGSQLGSLPGAQEVANLGIPRIPEDVRDKAKNTATQQLSGAGGLETTESAPPTEKVSDKAKTYPAFVLSEGLAPVPGKLVAKIVRGEFVDMAELLRDNIEALRRRSGVDTTSNGQSAKSTRREVPDILSWIQCFGVYAAVVASEHPAKLSQLLAYQTTVVREARRCGGAGWQGYDTMFRQHAATAGREVDWSQLNNSLYAVTFLAQQNHKGKTCLHCLETDHVAHECALAPRSVAVDQSLSGRQPGTRKASATDFLERERGVRSGGGSGRARNAQPSSSERVCYSWNDGNCRYPSSCRYRHKCVRCGGDHPANECKAPQKPKSGGQ